MIAPLAVVKCPYVLLIIRLTAVYRVPVQFIIDLILLFFGLNHFSLHFSSFSSHLFVFVFLAKHMFRKKLFFSRF